MKIEEISKICTGCSACMSVCPTQSIRMEMDEEGFYHPIINQNTCIKCGKCDRVCHCLRTVERDEIPEHHSFYGRTTNSEVLNSSTSGGVFYHLAQNILATGGLVIGAAFDYQSLRLRHASTDEVSLDELMKSKYLESDMADSISQIRQALKQGRKVLFCGTPCQVSGLKNAVDDPCGNLLTCDFICHGVPSTKIFQEYLRVCYPGEKIEYIDFRPKDKGWTGNHIHFKIRTDKKERLIPYYMDPYYEGFMRENAYLRECCYECQFRKRHSSDITIADFWGFRKVNPDMNDEKGISLLIANSDKGLEAVHSLSEFDLHAMDNSYAEYVYADRDYSRAHELKKKFFSIYLSDGFKKAANQCYMNQLGKVKIKYYIKKFLRKI